ncbi:cytochrome b [Desulfosarcina alkanivorans]|uniref:Cytochrome b n=2 Tax=Desulfosarcina alkanivorans TaxID=571177 RepID=A0A5K7YI56_9BACT|nr:cytochrome b [Desulfosarcina alkanivorans]
MFMNTQDRYGLIARLVHWVIAALVIGMLAGGSLLSLLPPGGFKGLAVAAHKSIGVLILLLAVTRLLWRSFNLQPRPLRGTPVQAYIARVLHVWLYFLPLLQPLSGILMSQAYGRPVVFFEGFSLPPLVWHSPLLGAFFREVHGVVAGLLTVTIVVHAVAALKHHFIDRDRTLVRMLKGR